MPKARKNSTDKGLLLNFRAEDGALGVTRETWREVSKRMNVSETDAIHIAMKNLARQVGVVEAFADTHLPSKQELAEVGQLAEAQMPTGPIMEQSSLLGANWTEIQALAIAAHAQHNPEGEVDGQEQTSPARGRGDGGLAQ